MKHPIISKGFYGKTAKNPSILDLNVADTLNTSSSSLNISLNESLIEAALNECDLNTSAMSINESDTCDEKNLPLRKRKVVDISDNCAQETLSLTAKKNPSLSESVRSELWKIIDREMNENESESEVHLDRSGINESVTRAKRKRLQRKVKLANYSENDGRKELSESESEYEPNIDELENDETEFQPLRKKVKKEVQNNVPQKRKPGRPKGSKNKKNKGKGFSFNPSERPWVNPKPKAKKGKSVKPKNYAY